MFEMLDLSIINILVDSLISLSPCDASFDNLMRLNWFQFIFLALIFFMIKVKGMNLEMQLFRKGFYCTNSIC